MKTASEIKFATLADGRDTQRAADIVVDVTNGCLVKNRFGRVNPLPARARGRTAT